MVQVRLWGAGNKVRVGMLCRCLFVYVAGWLRNGHLPRNSATPAAGAQSFYEDRCWPVSLG